MGIALIIVWLTLLIYVIVLLKMKMVEKKERKWVYMLIVLVIACSLLSAFDISLNPVITFLNNSFGRLSRLVVNI